MSRGVRAWALIGALLGVAGCTRPADEAAQPGPVILIVVDTLRPDHLSCYGYSRPTSPAICALAADGVRFERAYTTRTATTPAIASMLTGLYPHRHGVKNLYLLLPPAMTTLAERFESAGWATGGFISSFVMVRDFSGFEQGFDVYDDDVRTKELLRENYQRDAVETIDRALAWLGKTGPHAFLFLHLIEPHGPYTPPEPYLDRFALAAGGAAPDRVPDYQRLPGLTTVNQYVGRYDGEIATADDQLARFIDALRRRGWYDRATIVLVSDHGESFGEEGHWFEHGRGVHDAEARVPLILKPSRAGGDGPAPGTVVTTPVSVVDINRTLLNAAGLRGEDPADAGVDLAAVARSGTRPGAPPVTWLEQDGEVTVATHADRCSVRWALPAELANSATLFAAQQPTAWRSAARVPAGTPSGGDGACADHAALAVSPLLADRYAFTLSVPVAFRADMRDGANRSKFIAERAAAVPLADHEHEALRQLGYAE